MKTKVVIQYNGREISETDIVAKIKEVWIADGNKVKDLKNLTMYVKPEENKVYYVINDDITGTVDI